MKVLYLINHAGKAGTEKYVYNLVKAYKDKKCECFFAYNEEGLLLTQMKEENVLDHDDLLYYTRKMLLDSEIARNYFNDGNSPW